MKQHEADAARSLHIVVDPYKPRGVTDDAFEEMIAAAATLLYHAVRDGLDVTLALPRVTLRAREAESAGRCSARWRCSTRSTSRCISSWSATRCCFPWQEVGMTRRAREIETLLLTMFAAVPLYFTDAIGKTPVLRLPSGHGGDRRARGHGEDAAAHAGAAHALDGAGVRAVLLRRLAFDLRDGHRRIDAPGAVHRRLSADRSRCSATTRRSGCSPPR